MNEKNKTMIFIGATIVLVVLAFVTAPRKITPNSFLEQGELFFPDFTDPNAAKTLEVIDYDENTGSAQPFKITFSKGKWTIPSHYNYPADAQDRLAKTAAGVIGIKKDDFRSDNSADHEAFGVVDPLDETAVSLTGRGQRVTVKGDNDIILADFIVGKKVEARENIRFVRIPGQKRVYAVRMDIDISTKFSDWIETDLLKILKSDINRVILKDYSINERTRQVNERDVLSLDKKDDIWQADRMTSEQEVDDTKMNELLTALDNLSIVGVRPKPAGLTQSLQKAAGDISVLQSDALSLQSKGYFFSNDGRLLSNEGELQACTNDGVTYTLRFGEIVYGTGEAVTAGTDTTVSESSAPGENRYLFITTSFNEDYFKEPGKPENTDFFAKADSLWTDEDRKNKELNDAYEEWIGKVENGRKISQDLNAHFAEWYYVISADSFENLHLTRKDLVKEKEKEK
ncbi:hypothetical protein AMJ80_10170 [bacterium SM23_31]|nr:MAG: hypothetical protein AMJ80_10170 [bacterium SM23_31]